MKRLSFTLSMLLLAAQAAMAQSPPPGRPHGGPPIERIAQELNLDDAQKAEMKRILDEQRAKRESEREQFQSSGTRPTPEEMKTLMQQHDQELYQQLSGVLSADQLARFKQLQEERRQHMRHGPPPAPPGQ
jgi:Spy/CpxP family protein refolding chaperone